MEQDKRTTNTGQPNAQNSELPPEKHPSGARIEQMYDKGEHGERGETLRPSERPPHYDYEPLRDKPEGDRSF